MRRGRPPKDRKRFPDGTIMEPTLKELGISKKESYQCQLLAEIPKEEFERLIAKMHAEFKAGRGRRIGTTWFLRQAKMLKTPEPPDPETVAVLADLRHALLKVSSPDERQDVLDTLRRFTVELIDRYPDE